MNQTEHYGLSQWALTDRVRMADFNADNAKIDAALAALSGLQGGEIARLDAAMAAETQRVNAELAKKALASDLSTAKTGLETSLGGKLEQVTLLSSSFTASGSSYSIPVPGSEMAKCSLAMAVISSSTLTASSMFYAASGNGSNHHLIGAYNSESGLLKFSKGKNHVLIFFPMKGACPYVSGISYVQDSYSFFYSSVSYRSFTSLTITPPSGSSSLSGSGTIKIYGLQ